MILDVLLNEDSNTSMKTSCIVSLKLNLHVFLGIVITITLGLGLDSISSSRVYSPISLIPF